jgi:ATP-binding cassette, subfamily B, bacterial
MRPRRLLQNIGPFIGHERWRILGLALTALIGATFEAAAFLLVVKVAFLVATGDDRITVGSLSLTPGHALLVVFALVVASLTAGVWNSRISARITSRVIADSRKRLGSAFLKASWDVQSRERQGNLHQILTGHIGQISIAISAISTGLSSASSFLAFTLSGALVSFRSSAFILGGMLLMGLFLQPISKLTKRRAAVVGTASIDYAMRLAQVTSVARELSVFDVRTKAAEDLARGADDVAKATFRTTLIGRLTTNAYKSLMLCLLILGLTVVYLSGTKDVANLGAVVVLLVRAMSYSQGFTGAFQQLSVVTPLLGQALTQEHVYASNVPSYGDKSLAVIGSMTMHDVAFSYDAGAEVLHGITFSVRCGEAVGVVGRSGSGKSTLAQLLLRLRVPSEGGYLVNGQRAEEYSSESWARRVGFVPQEVSLIRGTVAENIRFFRDYLTDDDVVAAAQAAHIHDEILQLPDGYSTLLGSGARDLSGGQRQRIGFARALAARPDVIVLDEPTSALDMHSETLVQQTLRSLKGTITTFIIAHRLSTLADCDKILVLEDGTLTAFGSPSEVANTNEFLQEALRLSRLPG